MVFLTGAAIGFLLGFFVGLVTRPTLEAIARADAAAQDWKDGGSGNDERNT